MGIMTTRIAGFRGEFQSELEIVIRQSVAMAEAIPPEKYDWCAFEQLTIAPGMVMRFDPKAYVRDLNFVFGKAQRRSYRKHSTAFIQLRRHLVGLIKGYISLCGFRVRGFDLAIALQLSLPRARGLIARVNFHNRRHEGKYSASDLGVVIKRPRVRLRNINSTVQMEGDYVKRTSRASKIGRTSEAGTTLSIRTPQEKSRTTDS